MKLIICRPVMAPVALNWAFIDMSNREAACFVLLCLIFGPLTILATLAKAFARETRLAYRNVRSTFSRMPETPWMKRLRTRRERHNQKESPLLALPRELRYKIYEYTIPVTAVVEPVHRRYFTLETQPNDTLALQLWRKDKWNLSDALPPSKSAPEQWSRIANLTQVCRAMRTEALEQYYKSTAFAFERSRYHYNRDKWSLQRRTPMFLERWLRTRPPAVFPILKIMLISRINCPHDLRPPRRRARQMMDFSFQGNDDDDDGAGAITRHHCMNGEYLILLDFAANWQLRLVRPVRNGEGCLTLHDCGECLQRVVGMWRAVSNGMECKATRELWVESVEEGRVGWRDVLRVVDLVRDC